ncbi:hypothetical protein C8J56DRAFT_898802 [Mycena floridula]|nr:hypothetical protein C8J56DRAFT_898802 [Mycena floridula]
MRLTRDWSPRPFTSSGKDLVRNLLLATPLILDLAILAEPSFRVKYCKETGDFEPLYPVLLVFLYILKVPLAKPGIRGFLESLRWARGKQRPAARYQDLVKRRCRLGFNRNLEISKYRTGGLDITCQGPEQAVLVGDQFSSRIDQIYPDTVIDDDRERSLISS